MVAQLSPYIRQMALCVVHYLIEEKDLREWNDAHKVFWSRLSKALKMTKTSVTWAEEFDKRLAAA